MTPRRVDMYLRLAGAGLGVVLVGGGLVIGRIAGRLTRPAPQPPILTVIPAPTRPPTPSAPALSPVTPAATLTPTPPLPAAELFRLGELVEVYGTQGDGLRIREAPGLESTVLMLGLESEVFQVLEGPINQDGLRWWRIASPYDPAERGWAADSFLRSLGP